MAGFIELIAKIKPKNNGKYPLVDDVDVEMEDGSRLSEAIKKPRIPDGGTKGQILAKKSNTNGDAEWVEPLKTEDIDKKLESKLDKNLGSENSDKVLITDAEGNIITQNKEDFEGSGGTTSYNDLENKPQINGVELIGNKTNTDLKIANPTQEQVSKAVNNYLTENPVSGMTSEQIEQLNKNSEDIKQIRDDIGDIPSITSDMKWEFGTYEEYDGKVVKNVSDVFSRSVINISGLVNKTVKIIIYNTNNTPILITDGEYVIKKISTGSGNPNLSKEYEFLIEPNFKYVYITSYNYNVNKPSFEGFQKSIIQLLNDEKNRIIIENDLDEELKNKINFSFFEVLPIQTTKNRIPIIKNDYVVIFLDNLFSGYNIEKIQTISSQNINARIFDNKFLYLKGESIGNTSAQVRLYKKDNKEYSDYASLLFSITDDKEGAKKIIFIGDSITENMSYLNPLKKISDDGNYKIEFVGTLGDDIKNEGRGGWAAYNYATNDLSGMSTNKTNAFWDGEKFNFSWYMSQNNFFDIDYVFINLGTNDMIRGINDTSDIDEISRVISESYLTMVNSIREYDQNLPIVLWLPPTRSLIGGNNRLAIDKSLIANQILINTFDNREWYNKKVYLMHTYLYINPYEDYPTVDIDIFGQKYKDCLETIHPSEDSGGLKIAKGIMNQIKYLESLTK